MSFERIKRPEPVKLEEKKPKQIQTSNQNNTFTPNQDISTRNRAKFQYDSTQLNREINAKKEPNVTPESIQTNLTQPPTLEQNQYPTDSVNQIGFIDQTDGAQLRAYPAGTKTCNLLKPATQITVIGKYKYDHGWSYVRAIEDGIMLNGWLQTTRVNFKLPEPRAKLHLVQPGETAEKLAVQNFKDHVQPGQDLRFYENVLTYVNQQEQRDGVQPATEVLGITLAGVTFTAGKLIWLVSPEFAKTLHGVVKSGSITGGAVAKARTANHAVTDTLESIVQAIGLAPEVMSKDAWDAVSKHWCELLNGLLLFVGAETLSGVLALAPDPTMLSKIAASAIQFGLSAWGATGIVAAGGEALKFGSAWLEKAIQANGDPKKVHQASLELIKMLEFTALAALAAFGAKGNAVKGLKLANEIKLPPMGGAGELVTPEGVKLENPQSNPNLNEAQSTQQTQKPLAGEYKEPAVIAALKKLPHQDLFSAGALEHLIFGELKGTRMTGWHLYTARRPGLQVRIVKYFNEADGRGVYQAQVEGSVDGGKTWNLKTAKDHTFFSNNWSQAQLVDEVASAFKEGREVAEKAGSWKGISKSGLKIEGYLDSTGKMKTAFPIWGQ